MEKMTICPPAGRAWKMLGAALLLAGALVPSGGSAQTDEGTTTLTPVPLPIPAADSPWVSTWGTAASSPANDSFFLPNSYLATNAFNNQTIRLIVHTSLGGKKLRVRLSNEQGTEPVVIGGARIAAQAGPASFVPGSDRFLTFSGQGGITIPPGAPVVSDPVKLPIAAGANLTVSIYLPNATTITSGHPRAIQANYVSAPGSGDQTGALEMPLDPADPAIDQWPLLTGIEVKAPGAATIAAFGSSITDGFNSTVSANARWPDVLAKRLRKRNRPLGVINPSIVANRILNDKQGQSMLARFDRDVLARPGVKYVIIADSAGVEVDSGTSAAETIVGLEQLIARAHGNNVKIIGTTILPVYGFFAYTPVSEEKRQTVNAWIRTSGLFDGVVDFDAVIRDPADPIQINPAIDSGDHHHPTDAGYALMAQAIPLSLFQ